MLAPEAGPFVRTGGLGDVLAALPAALAGLGHDVTLYLPLYRQIDRAAFRLLPTGQTAHVAVGDQTYRATFARARVGGVEYQFVDQPELFQRAGLYVDPLTSQDYPDNDIRFQVFVRAALSAVVMGQWKPDLIHVHDWQTALTPLLLEHATPDLAPLRGIPTVLTLHNLGYQGQFSRERFHLLNLPDYLMAPLSGALEFYDKINWLKAGISTADCLTTVSPTYAHEITSAPEFGAGLEGVLASRSGRLHGILNGVDYATWSPSRDSLIPYKYSAANLARKRMNKVDLLTTYGLPIREETPLIGMISRLAEQKGFDLVLRAGKALLSRDVQLVVLGNGDPAYAAALRDLQGMYPDKLVFIDRFDDRLAHLIEAAADIYLMPSRYEPCGLNQMYSLKYGAVPVVRRTGGLADTVIDVDGQSGEGTGFLFREYTPDAMLEGIDRALALFSRKRAWAKVVKAGMQQDFSWTQSARAYELVYHQSIEGKG